jgi:hypothetical protein
MKVYMITVCHMLPEIISYSLIRAIRTMGRFPDHWVLIDNCWPIEKEMTSFCVKRAAQMVGADLVVMSKNVGGHGGFNVGIDYFKNKYQIEDEDLILLYDPDSNPLTYNWLNVMAEVMDGKKNINNLSLLHPDIMPKRKWNIEIINRHKFATSAMPEMYNVTCFRYSFLKKLGEFKGNGFYGGVETLNFSGLSNQGYLYDYLEYFCPIPHDPLYNKWKSAHASGQFKGNFDAYYELMGEKWT